MSKETREIAFNPEQGKRVLYKELQLISPQKARQIGLSAEEPVFISSVFDERIILRSTDDPYSMPPLVYRVGQTTHAQQFGIYSLDTFLHASTSTRGYTGFIATVEGFGVAQDIPTLPSLFKAEKVLVKAITPFYTFHPPLKESIERTRMQRMDQGVLVDGGYGSGILFPLCESKMATVLVSPFFVPPSRFQVRYFFRVAKNGEIVFRLPEKPTYRNGVIHDARRYMGTP